MKAFSSKDELVFEYTKYFLSLDLRGNGIDGELTTERIKESVPFTEKTMLFIANGGTSILLKIPRGSYYIRGFGFCTQQDDFESGIRENTYCVHCGALYELECICDDDLE